MQASCGEWKSGKTTSETNPQVGWRTKEASGPVSRPHRIGTASTRVLGRCTAAAHSGPGSAWIPIARRRRRRPTSGDRRRRRAPTKTRDEMIGGDEAPRTTTFVRVFVLSTVVYFFTFESTFEYIKKRIPSRLLTSSLDVFGLDRRFTRRRRRRRRCYPASSPRSARTRRGTATR